MRFRLSREYDDAYIYNSYTVTIVYIRTTDILSQFAACAICGVLCISLPIPIIVNNFNKFYEKAKIEEEIEAKRKRTSWEDAKRGKIVLV